VRPTLAILAAVFVILPGCGGGGESEEPAAGGPSVDVRATEFAFDPSPLTLDAAETVTFRVTNDGSVDHALEVEGNGLEEETETIAPGGSAELTVTLEDGTYEVYCPIGNHREQGMETTLTVGAGGTGTGTTTGEDEDEGYG
jgi:uncharacterized cupredoxin-like copper-binding protein